MISFGQRWNDTCLYFLLADVFLTLADLDPDLLTLWLFYLEASSSIVLLFCIHMQASTKITAEQVSQKLKQKLFGKRHLLLTLLAEFDESEQLTDPWVVQ